MARNHNRRKQIFRDRDTGVVTGRRSRHPMADVFTAIPNNSPDYPDADMPPFNLPEELKHLLAIHIFDNLYPGLGAPSAVDETVTIGPATYRLVNPTGADLPMGGAGSVWLPHAVDSEDVVVRAAAADPDGVPDVEDLTPAQLEALQAKIDQRQIDEERRQNLDTPLAADEPEWRRFRTQRLEDLERKLRARNNNTDGTDSAVDDEGDD